MKKFLLLGVSAAALAFANPANAVLQLSADVGGNLLHCVDNQGSTASCPGGDQNPATGNLTLQNGTSIGGVTLNGSISTSTGTTANGGPFAILNTGSLSIINTNGTTVHINAAVGDINFVGPVNAFNTSTSGVFQGATNSDITTTFFNDTTNTQGADTAIDGPGSPIDTFSFTAASIAASYSHDNAGAISDGALFSMTELLSLNLTANGQLVNRGSTEIKTAEVVEPGSLLILGSGLLGFGWLMRRRNRKHTMDRAVAA